MNKKKLKDQENQMLKEASRDDLLSFAVYTDKFFDIVWIHEIMWDALAKIESWEIKNLILELPPRSWKSRIVSEFIAKLLWKQGDKDIILTGHSASLLEWFSRNIKWRIESDEYQSLFDTKLQEWNTWVKNWKTNKWWEFSLFWVWGWITGKWGHYLIIDDPYASREEAESDTVRKKVSSWYWSTFLSRKQNENSAQIIIMQRWREDDLVWEILEKEWKNWTRISIPAISSEWKSFWESKFSVGYLKKVRKQIWEYFFMSQYQQDPVNEWGWDFQKDMFEYYDRKHINNIRERLNIISFLDPAISQKQEADFNALITIWVDIESNYIYLLQVKRLKTTTWIVLDEVFKTARMFRDIWLSYKFWVEIIAFQKMLWNAIKKEMRLRDFFFTFIEVWSQWNKVARIKTSLQPRYSTHSIIHPRFWENIWEFETELLKFPNWKHDDMIDSLSSAVILSEVVDKTKVQEVYAPDNDEWF